MHVQGINSEQIVVPIFEKHGGKRRREEKEKER